MSDWRYFVCFCGNGHQITAQVVDGAEEVDFLRDEFQDRHCEECGAGAVVRCLECGEGIREGIAPTETKRNEYDGYDEEPYIPDEVTELPKFCRVCGEPYIWTQIRINAAKELANEMEGLTPQERELFKQSIDDIVRNTPRAEGAAVRLKKLLAKGGEAVGGMLRDLLVDITSEALKKSLFPANP